MNNFSFFFDKIEAEKERIRELKDTDIISYAVERREKRQKRNRRYANKARAYMSVAGSDPCVYCGNLYDESKMTVDHIVPRFAGGTNDWENLAPACFRCNARKDHQSLLLFLVSECNDRRN